MTGWTPSLNSLRAFEAVARHLSYRDAALELSVTPAAVKQLVRKLEEAIGTKLVERNGRGLSLTAAGQSGTDSLGQAMQHLRTAVQKMRGTDGDRRLIVTVEASFATTWLVPKLEQFRSQYPGISVLIDSSQKVVDLAKSEADLAIRYGVPASDDLIVQRLFEDVVFPACSPSLAKGSPSLVSLEQLGHVPLIHWDMTQLPWANATRLWFDWTEWLKSTSGPPIDTTKGLRFSDYGLAVQAATSGRGMILASWPILKDLFDAELLVQAFPESARSTDIGYDLVTTVDALERPEVAAFSEWLLDTARSV